MDIEASDKLLIMQPNGLEGKLPIKERLRRVREEIAEIGQANEAYIRSQKSHVGNAEHERRLQRLQEILDELMSMTEWKKP